MNKTYQRKTLPKVTIINIVEDSIVEDGIDGEGKPISGVVTYLNEFGSKGGMPWKMFMEMYEEES